jgi:hypothetical protein
VTEIAAPVAAGNASAMHQSEHQQPCLNCSALYTPSRKWQRFCGAECRKRYHLEKARPDARLSALEREMKDLKRRLEVAGI